MIRFAVIGSGWRSLFYVRIAKALPQIFEMCMLMCRSEEKAKRFAEEYSIPTCWDHKAVLDTKPDFIVTAVSKDNMYETVLEWLQRGYPVFSETPLTLTNRNRNEIWQLCREEKPCVGQELSRQKPVCRLIQVAEQYWLYPTHEARIKIMRSGILGMPVSLSLSYAHGYHGASLMRRLLDVEVGEEVSVVGKSFQMPVTDTRTRYEVLTQGRVAMKEENHLTLEYESGKTAFFDFMSDQYRSPIRRRYVNLRGTRGEIWNEKVCWLDGGNLPREAELEVARDDATQEILSIRFAGEELYTPPFGVCGLPEDETAIARMLAGMKTYIKTGKEIYPLKESLEDDYTAALMEQAGREPWRQVYSGRRVWTEREE